VRCSTTASCSSRTECPIMPLVSLLSSSMKCWPLCNKKPQISAVCELLYLSLPSRSQRVSATSATFFLLGVPSGRPCSRRGSLRLHKVSRIRAVPDLISPTLRASVKKPLWIAPILMHFVSETNCDGYDLSALSCFRLLRARNRGQLHRFLTKVTSFLDDANRSYS